MFKLISDLILHNRLKFEQGRIELINQPVAMFPLDYIVTLQRDLEEKNQSNLVYFSSKKMGYKWFKEMYDYFKIKPEDVTKWGINILEMAGWGKTTITSLDTKKKIMVVTVHEATQSKIYGKSDKATDNFLRGCCAAAATVLFGSDCDAIEVKCQSLGDAYCEFICKPRSEIDMSVAQASNQLQL